MLAANDLKPLLHVVLVGEGRGGASPGRGEEGVQVELIELAAAGDS